MSKRAKVWIIIGSVLTGLWLAYLALIIVAIFAGFLNDNNFNKSLKKYGQESKLIYSDYKDIYYHNQKYDYEYEVLWIDDTYIIYESEGKYYIRSNDNTKELVLSDVEGITYGSLFVKKNRIYFISNDINYSYDVDDESLITISRKEYYEKRDGSKYSFDTSLEDGRMNISITDNENNSTKIIKSTKLYKMSVIKYLMSNLDGRLFNYYVWDDQIYLCLLGDEYSIILRYDFETEKLVIYDWFYRETSRTCYLAFKINNVDNCQILKTLIEQ